MGVCVCACVGVCVLSFCTSITVRALAAARCGPPPPDDDGSCLSVRLSLSVCLSVRLPGCLSVCLSVGLSVCLSVCVGNRLSLVAVILSYLVSNSFVVVCFQLFFFLL